MLQRLVEGRECDGFSEYQETFLRQVLRGFHSDCLEMARILEKNSIVSIYMCQEMVVKGMLC